MKIAIAPNAFKGSLTAAKAAVCIERGLRKALRGISTVKVPVADGGDGTLLAIVAATSGQSVRCRVTDPLGAANSSPCLALLAAAGRSRPKWRWPAGSTAGS